MEKWRKIINHPKYECSNYGNIRSTSSTYNSTYNGIPVCRKKKKKLIGKCLSQKGYKRINLDKKIYFVHRIIAITWIDNPLNYSQINHKDGNKLNNHIDNLEWVSNSENRRHAVVNKLHAFGEKQGHSKLKEMDIFKIFELHNSGYSQRYIAEQFCVCQQSISRVINRKTWKHLSNIKSN